MTTPKAESTSVLRLTDLHLDRATHNQTEDLLRRIRSTPSDCVIVTGDISDAGQIRSHLTMLANACAPRPLYFLMGNHDYYGGSFQDVEKQVGELCRSTPNLHHLDGSRIIPLGKDIGLIGHRGWPDARAGEGMATCIESPDRWRTEELRGLDHRQMLERMQSMGHESAARIRRVYPLALTCYRHVIVATHVPPFYNAVFYRGRPADEEHLPHFCNLSVGLILVRVLRSFPHRHVTVLAGHSHGECVVRIKRNLTAHVGASRDGGKIAMELLRFAA